MKLQLVVWHLGQSQPLYYQIPAQQGWRIDTLHRQIVVGTGIPRTMIPLDSVLSYSIEEVGSAD